MDMQKFEIDGKTYEYDGSLPVEDAMFIYEKSGVGINRLNAELFAEGNPKVIAAFMFMLRRRAGDAVRWDDTKKWDVLTFKPIYDDPEFLKAQRDLLQFQLKTCEDRLALVEEPADPEERGAADEADASDPTATPTGSAGKSRKRATSRT